jgi:L-fucose isomerase-like protein
MSCNVTRIVNGSVQTEQYTIEKLISEIGKSEKERIEREKEERDEKETIDKGKKVWTKKDLIDHVEKVKSFKENRDYFISTLRHFSNPDYEMYLSYEEDTQGFIFYISRLDNGKNIKGMMCKDITGVSCIPKNLYGLSPSQLSQTFRKFLN